MFFNTPTSNLIKELILKIGTLTFSSNQATVQVPDATGEYVPNENPGGYNPPAEPFNPYRPHRNNLNLWTVYRIWNVYGPDTQTPDNQSQETVNPYEYTLTIPTEVNEVTQKDELVKGIYEIILIGAPRFDEVDTEGTFLSDDNTGTYHLISGADTNFEDVLSGGYYVYIVDGTNGNIDEVGQVDNVFSNTSLNLSAAPGVVPAVGDKLYGSVNQIAYTNSGGTVDGYTSNVYSSVTGNNTDFATNFAAGQTLFYIETATGDYKPMGEILDVINAGTLYLINLTGNTAVNGEAIVSYSGASIPAINSEGTFNSNSSTTIAGTNTQFTKFTAGQTLFYQDALTGELKDVAVIDSIIDDNNLLFVSPIDNQPVSGDRLFAANTSSVALNTSDGGSFSSLGAEATYYTLTGTGTTFTNFTVGDYVYVYNNGAYNALGQANLIQSNTSIVFYTPNNIVVEQGDFIVASTTQITLIDIDGTYEDYTTGTIHLVTGSGTQFLTKANENDYLFYDDGAGGYELMGQIFKVFDDENVWLYEAAVGNAGPSSQLYTSTSTITTTANYADYIGNPALYSIAKEYPNWYVTSVGVMVDPDVANCLQKKRYAFLQSVMCGNCDESYLGVYAIYVGMLSAMEVQDWAQAILYYDRLKTICKEMDESSCGC